jgi:ribosome-binding factor A
MRPHRLEKLASTIRWVVSDAIANKLNDPRISRFASVTRVEVAADLALAKVYVSVMGSPSEQRRTMQALQHAAGHVQRLLAQRLETRQCPQVRFVVDASLKVAAETMRLLRESGAASTADAESDESKAGGSAGAEADHDEPGDSEVDEEEAHGTPE